MTVTSAAICTGVLRLVVVPSPSWPSLLPPIAHSVPSVFTNRLWRLPAEMRRTSVSTCTGVGRKVVVPSPSWP